VTGERIGQRYTAQRAAIIGAIRAAEGPLTTAQVHERAGRVCDGLGIATVYRNIKLLLDSGEIKAVTLPDGDTRYESASLGHHHHFQCRGCGRVFDLDECPVELRHGQTLAGGFIVNGHELTLFGVCPECVVRRD
jgi:Fur family ferric uptake transcriptional regulator